MGIISIIIIFICLCVDNMVSANMSAMKMTPENKSVFSIKMGLFFAGFNTLLFGLGYLLSVCFFRKWVSLAGSWVAFAFLLLLGIKFMLESIEKSPSFSGGDMEDTRKLIKVSALVAMNSFLVGYAVETTGAACFPAFLLLALITFVMTLIGFHIGKSNSKTIVSKRVELVAGVVLIIMALRLIII